MDDTQAPDGETAKTGPETLDIPKTLDSEDDLDFFTDAKDPLVFGKRGLLELATAALSIAEELGS